MLNGRCSGIVEGLHMGKHQTQLSREKMDVFKINDDEL
jgi:hypothetical protein